MASNPKNKLNFCQPPRLSANSFRVLSLPVCAAVLLLVLCSESNSQAQQAAQAKLPFDVFGDVIESDKINRHFSDQGAELVSQTPDKSVDQILAELGSSQSRSQISLASLTTDRPATPTEVYQHMVKSSLFFGVLYDCGRCDKMHGKFAGGVVIDSSGLVLTNHHVIEKRVGSDSAEAFMAMTYDGKCFEIEEVLAADQAADVALVQLKANGHQFHAAPLAAARPSPMDPVRVISHPSGQFMVLTTGEVSRYVPVRTRSRRRYSLSDRMEITAPFGAGSSGSGVFNADGEVVGLVSSIFPIVRYEKAKRTANNADDKATANPTGEGYAEMVLRRCVTLKSIKNCFLP